MTRRGPLRAAALAAILALAVLAACGCGRKAKPEPLWGASRATAIIDRSR